MQYFHWLGRDADPLRFEVRFLVESSSITFKPELHILPGDEIVIASTFSDKGMHVESVHVICKSNIRF